EAGPDVVSALAGLGKGDRATIDVVRDGKQRVLEATLAVATSGESPLWLRDWPRPFDDSWWFRDWLTQADQTKHDAASTRLSEWFDQLRELFQPTRSTAASEAAR